MGNLRIKPHPHHWMAFIGALVVLFGAYMIASTRHAAAEAPVVKAGEHIITVHDDGAEVGFITKEDTLRKAFADEGISVSQYDRVEPGLDESLVAASYEVNIYRARPVVIRDGSSETRIVTAYRSAKQIVKQADMTLRAEDEVKLTPSTNILADGAAEILTITRAVPFNFYFYGHKLTSYTLGKTVREMLEAKNITLTDKDFVTPSADTPIAKDMTVKLWRNGAQTVTVDETVKYTTKQIKDADRPVGYKKVTKKGVNGERTATYTIVMKDGNEVSRKLVNATVTKKAVQQVMVVGTKPELTPFTGGGSKAEWLAAAGIAREHWGAADAIVSQESGWNPNAINSSSGACGLAQALPCNKVPGNPLDPVDSLTWMNSYVYGRYGGWEGALAFKRANGWY